MDKGIHKYTCQEASNLQIGQAGFDVISTATTETGNWVAIYNSSADTCTITTISPVGDNLSSFVLLSGDMIYGNFTSVECETGSRVLLLYRG